MQSDQSFKDWFAPIHKLLAEGAERIMFEQNDQQIPMLMVFGPENQAMMVPFLQFGDIETKNFATGLQRHLAGNDSTLIPGVVFISETWVVRSDARTQEEHEQIERMRRSKEGIADHPDRTEGLMINAMRHPEMQLLAMYDVDRKARKLTLAYVVDPQDPKQGLHDGRMVVDPTERNPQ